VSVKPIQLSLAGLAAAVIVAANLSAQNTGDPWTRVVAFPSACYTSQDQFSAKSQTVIDALTGEISKQNEINHQPGPQPGNTDPFEIARRMQEAMMKDPQAAMKLMETAAATDAASVHAEMAKANQRTVEWQDAEKALRERYQAALTKAYQPLRDQFQALQKRVGGDPNSPFLPELGIPASAYAEHDVIKRSMDKTYGGLCAQWFGANGEMPAFLKRYKDYLLQERIPQGEKTDAQRTMSQAMLGGSSSYKSTTTLEAVEDYMKLATRLFADRENAPRCTASKCN
jgi:hypothetical protein